jgi:KDO2-lipid IV(A) lauroyltransferase
MVKILSVADKIKLVPLWTLTLLPLRALFIFSDFLFIITYYIVRYRRSVVLKNLKNSFPEKSMDELKRIRHHFYRYLTDYFFESLYITNMSLTECHRRYTFTNADLLNKFYLQGRDVIVVAAHYGNWEWATSITGLIPYRCLGIYKPLSNKLFDRFFIYLRSKYGGIPIPVKDTLRAIVQSRKNNERFALYLVADQRPIREDLGCWTIFLNQDTPVITGIERLSRKYDAPVLYMNVERLKRGYYSVSFDLVTDKPNDEKEMNITINYMRKVEDTINKRPEFWLWTHKRWKYNASEFKPRVIHS